MLFSGPPVSALQPAARSTPSRGSRRAIRRRRTLRLQLNLRVDGHGAALRLRVRDGREMVILDPYGAADFDEANANLKRAAACGHKAALVWRELISDSETTVG